MKKLIIAGIAVAIASVVVFLTTREQRGATEQRSEVVETHAPSASSRRSLGSSSTSATFVREARRRPVTDAAPSTSVERMTIPPELRSPPLQDGELRLTSAPPDPAVIEGAISVYELLTEYQPLAAWIQNGIGDSVMKAVIACKAAFLARGGVLAKEYAWAVGLHIVSDGKVARIADVLVLSDHWPDVFDEQAKQCWLDALAQLHFASDKVVDVTVEYSFALMPR